jgi:sugar lactone lactonase YvrE
MRLTALRAASALLLAVAVGCADDSTAPAPPPPPPPSAQDGLWTGSGTPAAILRLDPTQLSDNGKRDPATTLTTPSARLETLITVAFDPAGAMWIASADESLLLGFAPGALASSGSRAATSVLQPIAGSLSGPTGLAFDSQHRLWVANILSGTLVRFDPAQLAAGGAQVPAVVVSGAGNPVALAFDAAGSLWVSDNQLNTVVMYTAAQLALSGSPAPARVLTVASALMNPTGLAFDAAGNLWVANTGFQNLLAFSPAQLADTGSPAPHVVISSNAGSSPFPWDWRSTATGTCGS